MKMKIPTHPTPHYTAPFHVRAVFDPTRGLANPCQKADMIFNLRAALFSALALMVMSSRGALADFTQTDLITSATDPFMINPWGISSSPTGPYWVSDNGTGLATLYNGLGVKQGLVVSMPAGGDAITGQVFNGTASFHGDTFLFASENGTIDGWRGALGTNAEQVFSVAGAVYKGLAISNAKDLIYAANFKSGTIDIFNSTGLTLSLSDPAALAGYAPFNIQNLGGKFYVTYALQDAAQHDDVAGVGHGFVDVFNPLTNTFSRLVTGSAAGGTVAALDSPWGLALAPSTFGPYGGSLLVGNFGDGIINAFDPTTGALLGNVADNGGHPLVNPGLWGLTFANSSASSIPGALYFTAGGANENSGVFGVISPSSVPEPTAALFGLALCGVALLRRRTPR